MTSDDSHFTKRLGSDPALVALAATSIDGAYGETNGRLFARRYLETELGAGPDGIGEWAYREAAGVLRSRGHAAEAQALAAIADTSGLLAESAARWAGRYAARPVTAAEREGLRLIEEHAVRPVTDPDVVQGGGLGADGARYTPAAATAPGGAPVPAVIITTHAGTAEVVTGFGPGFSRDDWLADRLDLALSPAAAVASPGLPLRSSAEGPACRTAREERALAWLLTGCPGSLRTRQLGERSFTSCTRAEIYLAWRDLRARAAVPPGAAAVREELACRLLRAPGWAATFTGWPYGHLALAYFDRLAATPVSDLQGRAACRDVAREDAEALRDARAAGPARRRSGRPAWHPSCGPGFPPLLPPRPDDPSPGLGPRH